jgi:hypothetical protein
VRRILAILGVAGSFGVLTSPAFGAVTIGQTFAPINGCGASTFVQSASPSDQYAAPTPGVITSWSYQAGTSPPSELRLKVARAAGGDDFLVVGESDFVAPLPGVLRTYPARVQVQAGDVIGFYQSQNVACDKAQTGYSDHYRPSEDPAPGSTPLLFQPEPNAQLDIAATLEPDADNDGYGDETQDQCPTDASTHGSCPVPSTPTPTPKARKCKKHKKKHRSGAVVAKKKCKKKHHH